MKKKKPPHKIYIDPKGRAILIIPARDRDDLDLENGDKYYTEIGVGRTLIVHFEIKE
jgi:bifunctional DNA-binding transcriptional regulator/antitoxin component of YhaV-PrlF toxin-antitoxin module